jgi:hypothetical protein
LVLLVFFSRAWLIHTWGSPLPFWDQWDAEAATLYAPWMQGTLHARDLFAAHNEHRVVLTRLADLGLFIANGGWNPWSQLLLNAALHAIIAGSVAAIFWETLAPKSRAIFFAGIAMLFVSTAGWQNALWGFQSQVYFASLLGVVAIAGITAGPPLRGKWWIGWTAALLGLFANASGLLGVVAIFLVAFAAAWVQRDRASWLAAGATLVPLALGLALRVEPPAHAALHARDAGEFTAVFAHSLAWPHVDRAWVFVLMIWPLCWLVIRRRRERRPLDFGDRCALALGLLGGLHAAAIAYSRGAGLIEHRPLSRYQDPLVLGVAAQLFAVARLAVDGLRLERIAFLGWGATLAAGLITLTATNLTLNLPFKRAQDRLALPVIRSIAANPTTHAPNETDAFTIVHPSNPDSARRVLTDPTLVATLPAFLRENTPVELTAPKPIAWAVPLTLISAVFFGVMLLRLTRARVA